MTLRKLLATPIPLGVFAASLLISLLHTMSDLAPWPLFIVYADLQPFLSHPFEGARLVVLIVDLLALVLTFLIGKQLLYRVSPRKSGSFVSASCYLAAFTLVCIAFLTYPKIRSVVHPRVSAAEEVTVVLTYISWHDKHEEIALVLSSTPEPLPRWVDITRVTKDTSYLVHAPLEDMRQLVGQLRSAGYYELPHRLDVASSMDHSLFGISVLTPDHETHVWAKFSSNGWQHFQRSLDVVTAASGSDSASSWQQTVPSSRQVSRLPLSNGK